jgi:hypothetical protein
MLQKKEVLSNDVLKDIRIAKTTNVQEMKRYLDQIVTFFNSKSINF